MLKARPLFIPCVTFVCLGLLFGRAVPLPAQGEPAASRPGPAQPGEALVGKQAVIDTARGPIVLDLLAEDAPNHVAHFIKTAQEGGYDGTIFHRVVRRGIVQGGDPLSKDPAVAARYGTGGLNLLKREPNVQKHTRGAVSAVLVPGRPDSAGTQFFICLADQPALDGEYTVFARVAEGIAVAEAILEVQADDKGVPLERLVVKKIAIRERPPEVTLPFTTESVEALASYRAVLDTSLGAIAIEFLPHKAPEHVRNFLRLAALGVYDGMSWHRVVKGFVVQTGHLPARRESLSEVQQKAVQNLKTEFNDQPHDLGTVSMARLGEVDSASTSFFIVTAPAPRLDGEYTAFGRVTSGLEVVQAIENVPVDGETPRERVELRSVRIERKP